MNHALTRKGRQTRDKQSDEEKSDVGVKQSRTEEAAPLQNAVKEIRWNKEGENSLRSGYGKESRSTKKRQRKAAKELEKEAMVLWQRNRDLGLISKANIHPGLDESFKRSTTNCEQNPSLLLSSVPPGFIPPLSLPEIKK